MTNPRSTLATLFAVMVVHCVGAEAQTRHSIPDIAETALRSVARVEALGPEVESIGGGSGFFISGDGKLVTNFHVVDGASSALVKLQNGAIYKVAGFVAASQEDDVVILQVSGSSFEPLPLGEPGALRVGEQVIAIGSPLRREGTVSTGIVSAFREGDGCEGLASKCIQTTAPISPGSSGGPLMDLSGAVAGVTSALVPGGQSLNFAVSADLVTKLLSAIHPPRDLESLHMPVFLGPEPTIWTSARDGTEWRVRRIGGTIYSERLASEELRAKGFSSVCEYTYAAEEQTWEGACRVNAPTRCGSDEKVCSFKVDDTLVSVKPEQITRVALMAEKINCSTCTITKSRWAELVLLPQEPVTTGLQPAAVPQQQAPKAERLKATIKGKVVDRADDTWAFSWALLLTNNEDDLLEAEATIQFLDSEGLPVATAKETGLQIPPQSPVTFRGVTEIDADVAAQVESLGVKVRAESQ